jgi:uracil-DNA glycosylase
MVRISQAAVSPLFPPDGPVKVLLFGEAPGPLGADKSGVPFWGDRAGVAVYRALEAAGLATVPARAYEDWDGQRLKEAQCWPLLRGAALSNAFPSCPTRDGQTFRAPTDAELKSEANLQRLRKELLEAAARCEGTLCVITMGRRAAWILGRIPDPPPFELCELPHPSAQGLLQAAPGKGRGLKLEDLRRAWVERLGDLLKDEG